MPYTYPARIDTGKKLSAAEVHQLLRTPNVVATRMASLVTDRFIADYLLPERYDATGAGAVLYRSTQEPVLLANDEPIIVGPGAEYPLTTVNDGGEYVSVATLKRGHDSEVTDEEIARDALQPVNKVMAGLGNSLVRSIDRLALAAIKSKATLTYDVAADGGNFTSAEGMVTAVLMAKAKAVEMGLGGYNYDTMLLTARQYAKIQAMLINSGNLPREAGNPILSGAPIQAFGLNWVTSENDPFIEPTLIDRNGLGGMADENIGGGYTRASTNGGDTSGAPAMTIETKAMREDHRDSWRLRVRRVTVPVITDSNAALRLVNTGV